MCLVFYPMPDCAWCRSAKKKLLHEIHYSQGSLSPQPVVTEPHTLKTLIFACLGQRDLYEFPVLAQVTATASDTSELCLSFFRSNVYLALSNLKDASLKIAAETQKCERILSPCAHWLALSQPSAAWPLCFCSSRTGEGELFPAIGTPNYRKQHTVLWGPLEAALSSTLALQSLLF